MLTHPALLVVDEIGYLPVNQDGAVLFFQLINARHERASTVLTSNKGFEDWGGVLGDEVMAAALIDRLVHHCHIVKHPGQQLPDEGSSEPAPVRFGSTLEKSRRVIAGSNGDRSGDTRPLWITGLSRQTLGGRCANTVTYSSTKSDTPNTASGGTTARSK